MTQTQLRSQARHVRQCRREAIVAVLLWTIGLVWTLVAVLGWGYVPVDARPSEPSLVWGLPAWVFWGLFVHWVLQIVAAWWFALCVLKDDEPLD